MSQERKQVKISEVLEMLNEGMNRNAIKKHLGLTVGESKLLFSHEKLKDVKPNQIAKGFTVIDDLNDNIPETTTTATDEVPVETPEIPEPIEQVQESPVETDVPQDAEPAIEADDAVDVQRSDW